MRQRKNRAFIYIKQHFIVWFRGEIKEKSFACQRQRNSDIDLNSLKPPNNCYFCKFIMFINALNPHKSSVLNRLTSAPSSMPFISNFDFSYPKCHVFESHCRYQKFQSSWLLGWIFWCVGNCIKPSAWARLWCVADFGGSEGGLSPLLFMSKCRNFGISALFLSHLQ